MKSISCFDTLLVIPRIILQKNRNSIYFLNDLVILTYPVFQERLSNAMFLVFPTKFVDKTPMHLKGQPIYKIQFFY